MNESEQETVKKLNEQLKKYDLVIRQTRNELWYNVYKISSKKIVGNVRIREFEKILRMKKIISSDSQTKVGLIGRFLL